MEYQEFLESKKYVLEKTGIEVKEKDLSPLLKDFQKYVLLKALKNGKFAIFGDCGLGKTFMSLEWARLIIKKSKKPVLILEPLAVVDQTISEGVKFGIKSSVLNINEKINSGIYVSNYEQINNIDFSLFSGVVLDESSILKNFKGATKVLLLDLCKNIPYKLCLTATPSPNDELEIGNHAEFLNIMTSQDMRAVYFTTDKEIIKGNKYRLKKHSSNDFYKWISTWALMFAKPSDIGFSDEGYNLPGLNFIEKQVNSNTISEGKLFNDNSVSATQFNSELRITKIERMEEVANIVNNSKETFLIWIKHNEEGEYLKKMIPEAIEVSGSDSGDVKKKNLLGFANGEFRVLITKTKIASFGMNFQNCNNQIFASLDFSFESLYQAIRRSYRFGQKNIVNIYLITIDTMQNVINSINEKQEKFNQMQKYMKTAQTSDQSILAIKNTEEQKRIKNDFYEIRQGDSIEMIKDIPSDSIGYSFFSPPFGALYVFSNDPSDLSNVKNDDEFMHHFEFLVPELFRVLKEGRLVSIHIMQGTTLLGRDGFYSIKDLRGDIIRLFQKHGFYFHEEHMIRKDPKTAAIRTKNRQLMHGTTKKDSTIVRPGLADYIISFKKPGENKEPVLNNIPFDLWCEMAEPVWINVLEGDTLEYRSAKDNDDERHLTPTQLKPIEWCSLMYSNKGDVCFCPFGGIGSEGFQWIKMDRKPILFELKESYFNVMARNLANSINLKAQAVLEF